MGILAKFGEDNYLDNTFLQFEHSLEQGRIGITAIPGHLLLRSWCPDCDEETTVLRYKGRRIHLVPAGRIQMGKKWIMHQCPQRFEIGPEEGQDEPQRDGDGEIV